METKYLLAPLSTLMVGTITVTLSVYLWRLNQRSKALSYQILSRERLINARGAIRQRLDIRFDGLPAHDVEHLVFSLFNSGHAPVSPSDFQSRLRVSVNPDATILLSEISETSPATLDQQLEGENGCLDFIEKAQKTQLILRPLLLNPKDGITIQLLVQNLKGDIKVDGHILGVSQIKEWSPHNVLPNLLTHGGVMVMVGAALLIKPVDIAQFGFLDTLPSLLLFLMGVTLVFAGTFLPRIRKPVYSWESVS